MPHLGDSFTVHSDHFRAAGLNEDAVGPVVTAAIDQRQRVVLEATDAKSDVAGIEYTITKNGRTTVPWTAYDGAIRTDAASVVSFRATDTVGNVSDVGSATLAGLRAAQ